MSDETKQEAIATAYRLAHAVYWRNEGDSDAELLARAVMELAEALGYQEDK